MSYTSKSEKDALLSPRLRDKLSLDFSKTDQKMFYKGSRTMSTTAFETMMDELAKQKAATAQLSRSLSIGALSQRDMELNAQIVTNQGRRALYGTLPFVSAFGMQGRESSVKKFVTAASCNALETLSPRDKAPRILSDVDVDELIVTLPLLMAVIVAVILQFLLGFNTAVMNAPAAVVFPDHTTAQWAVAVSAFAIGGPFGALFGGSLADEKGRRGAILIDTWIFFLGGIMMTLAPNVYWLIPARLIIGFASGLASVVVPVYLGEIAPPTLRGTLGTCTQFACVIGILISGLCGIPLATTENWRYLFAITPILCLIQIAVSPYLFESPRWLLGRDEHSMEARIVIKKLRGFRSDGDVETEVQHFLFAATKHQLQPSSADSTDSKDRSNTTTTNTSSNTLPPNTHHNPYHDYTEVHETTPMNGGRLSPSSAERGSTHTPDRKPTVATSTILKDLWQQKHLRVLTISAIVLQMSQQLCGINAVFYYSTTFFEGLISNPLVGTNLVAFVNVLATYVALKLMDTTARRTLILWSSGGMLISTAFIIGALKGVLPNYVALIAVMAFVSFFEIGLGPVPWLIVAEMFDAKYVATAMSMSCIANWSCNFLVGITFPYLQLYLNAWSFGPFAGVLLLAYIFAYYYMMETYGRSVDDLERILCMDTTLGIQMSSDKHIMYDIETYDSIVDIDTPPLQTIYPRLGGSNSIINTTTTDRNRSRSSTTQGITVKGLDNNTGSRSRHGSAASLTGNNGSRSRHGSAASLTALGSSGSTTATGATV